MALIERVARGDRAVRRDHKTKLSSGLHIGGKSKVILRRLRSLDDIQVRWKDRGNTESITPHFVSWQRARAKWLPDTGPPN